MSYAELLLKLESSEAQIAELKFVNQALITKEMEDRKVIIIVKYFSFNDKFIYLVEDPLLSLTFIEN